MGQASQGQASYCPSSALRLSGLEKLVQAQPSGILKKYESPLILDLSKAGPNWVPSSQGRIDRPILIINLEPIESLVILYLNSNCDQWNYRLSLTCTIFIKFLSCTKMANLQRTLARLPTKESTHLVKLSAPATFLIKQN